MYKSTYTSTCPSYIYARRQYNRIQQSAQTSYDINPKNNLDPVPNKQGDKTDINSMIYPNYNQPRSAIHHKFTDIPIRDTQNVSTLQYQHVSENLSHTSANENSNDAYDQQFNTGIDSKKNDRSHSDTLLPTSPSQHVIQNTANQAPNIHMKKIQNPMQDVPSYAQQSYRGPVPDYPSYAPSVITNAMNFELASLDSRVSSTMYQPYSLNRNESAYSFSQHEVQNQLYQQCPTDIIPLQTTSPQYCVQNLVNQVQCSPHYVQQSTPYSFKQGEPRVHQEYNQNGGHVDINENCSIFPKSTFPVAPNTYQSHSVVHNEFIDIPLQTINHVYNYGYPRIYPPY